MSASPGSPASFGERLDVLLDQVPRVAGSSARFEVEDVITMVSTVVAGRGPRRARAIAESWLRSARANPEPPGAADRPALEALASLFRVPADYFTDDRTRELVLRRLALARRAEDARVRVIGPCRARRLPPATVELINRELLDALDRGRLAGSQ